ncbi:efflux RND transporter periplasmic adaptor subunit [Paraflavisolibacter sp. H34]|uniref:efflux RND transporter periplasmic adaptor subunit n=1 Tax=Huijunlia imazamoxiresistens TaxID=3127457 RepID=UPI00301B4837
MRIIPLPSFLFLLCASTLLLASCGHKEEKIAAPGKGQGGKGGRQSTPKVDVFVVSTQEVQETLEVPGTLVAEDATEIHPEVSGRITSLNIREGAQVSKGAVLARLYDGDLQAQRRKLQVQLEIARQTEGRHEKLLKIGGISKEDYNNTTLQVNTTTADLDIINTEIAKTVIRAPFSGKLGLKQISVGAYVTPQTIVASIQKTNALRLDFSLPEKYISQVKAGQTIHFTIDGSDQEYTAKVMATESGIDQATRSLTIRARVSGVQSGLVPGGFAKVQLAFQPDPNALLVPTQAIIPQARGKKVALYHNGTAKFVDVTTGIRDSAMVQITSGLKKADTVIVTGLLSVKPDAKVQLNKVVSTGK